MILIQPPPQPRPSLALLLCLLAVLCVACDERPAPDGSAANAQRAAAASAPEDSESPPEQAPALDVDALRGLPYSPSAGPADPNRSGVTRHDDARSSRGYNLLVVERQCAVELLTPRGAVARRWQLSQWEEGTHCQHWGHAELLDDGSLLVIHTERVGSRNPDTTAQTSTRAGDEDGDPIDIDNGDGDSDGNGDKGGGRKRRYLLKLSAEGEVVWKRRLRVHHEFDPLPDGRILALGSKARLIPAVHPEVPVQDNRLLMLSADGQVQRDLSLTDLLLAADPRVARLQEVQAREKSSGRETVGLLHCNGVQWIPATDDAGPAAGVDRALVTCRHQDLVFAVAWTQEPKVLWSWGQGELAGPHDATALPNGRVLVFDNGLGRGWSRVLELETKTGEILWQYRAGEPPAKLSDDELAPRDGDLYTATRGSAQRLPNGNTLLAESEAGRALEVTPDGEVVWEYWSSHIDNKGDRAIIPKIRRLPPQRVEALLRGGPIP